MGKMESRRNFVRPMRGRGCFRNENFQPMRVEACFQLGKSPQPPPLKTTEEKGSNYTRKNGETAIFEILSRAFSLRQHFGFGRFFPKVTKNNSSKFFQKFQVLDNYVAFLFYFSEGKLRRFAWKKAWKVLSDTWERVSDYDWTNKKAQPRKINNFIALREKLKKLKCLFSVKFWTWNFEPNSIISILDPALKTIMRKVFYEFCRYTGTSNK